MTIGGSVANRKKAQPQKPAEDDRDRFIRLFTDELADLDLFRQGETVYHVTDAASKERTYAIPNDPPFPVALAFLRAHDGLIRAQVEHAKAKGKTQEALLGKVEATWTRLVGKPPVPANDEEPEQPERSGAFLELLRVRQPDLPAAELAEIGAGMTANWMATVVTRLHLARMGTDFDSFLARVLETPRDVPKAPTKTRNRSASSR